jgi:hypothetical protein
MSSLASPVEEAFKKAQIKVSRAWKARNGKNYLVTYFCDVCVLTAVPEELKQW